MPSTDQTWIRVTLPNGGTALIGYGNEKNRALMQGRAVSFDQVILELSARGYRRLYLDEREGHRHRNQWILEIEIAGYTYLCPCKLTKGPHHEDAIFLKTCYPSRKATRRR